MYSFYALHTFLIVCICSTCPADSLLQFCHPNIIVYGGKQNYEGPLLVSIWLNEKSLTTGLSK